MRRTLPLIGIIDVLEKFLDYFRVTFSRCHLSLYLLQEIIFFFNQLLRELNRDNLTNLNSSTYYSGDTLRISYKVQGKMIQCLYEP